MEFGEWEELKGESNVWKPKTGESVEGELVEMIQGQYGIQATIQGEDGKRVILPSHKVLQSRIVNCKLGDHIRVIYEKDELPKVRGQQPTRIYKVLRRSISEEDVK